MNDVQRLMAMVRAAPRFELVRASDDEPGNVRAAFSAYQEFAGLNVSHETPQTPGEVIAAMEFVWLLCWTLGRLWSEIKNEVGLVETAIGPPGFDELAGLEDEGALRLFWIVSALHDTSLIEKDFKVFAHSQLGAWKAKREVEL